jgi:hypothetical protein
LGGVLPSEEIILLAVITGIAYVLNRKLGIFALLITGALLVNFLHPNINQDVKGMREAQLNPPGKIADIVINHDGEYDLPDRPLKVCFTQTGDPAKPFYVDQQIIIEGIWQITRRETGCDNIPESVSGKKVKISLGIPGKQYTPEIKKKWGFGPDINNDYDYYESIGVSQKPFIQAR